MNQDTEHEVASIDRRVRPPRSDTYSHDLYQALERRLPSSNAAYDQRSVSRHRQTLVASTHAYFLFFQRSATYIILRVGSWLMDRE